ncbi:SDR family oxidoreductase [Halomicrobium katesii]|uniref:SDR family oxidoreductase n=1 Tax=Halomicrobium katesii TaxID=437163 RepID=UPI00036E1A62|nr:SDR family oxidoreductase [Halomicrobium katesii]
MPTVLLTGAASGIGRATAESFLDNGWTVYATDIDADGLDELAREGCHTEVLDVTDDAAVEAVVERVETDSGGIDCLVNNAGYGQMGPVEDVPIDRMRAQFDVNYWGAIRCTKAVLAGMRERGGGTVVTVASVMGQVASPGWGAYAGSKHALEGTSDALRVEVATEGIDVVLVEPAWVRTGFADRVHDRLAGFDRTGCYERIYESLEGNGVVGGGPLSVTPDRVANRIVAAAESSDPVARYTVGLGARAIVLSGLLPDAVRDYIQRLLIRRFSEGR